MLRVAAHEAWLAAELAQAAVDLPEGDDQQRRLDAAKTASARCLELARAAALLT